MRQDIIKELRFGIRNSRFLILTVSFLFYAFLTPVMLKVILPQILKSQFPGMGEDLLSQMIDMTQSGSLQSYIGDIFELGMIIVAFTLCGLLAQDIRENTLVMPLCAGKSYHGIVLSKLLVFGSALLIIPILALATSYVYAGLLFTFEVPFAAVVLSGAYQGIYMVFLLALLLFTGTIISKPIATGLIALGIAYGQNLISGLFNVRKWFPAGLTTAAAGLSAEISSETLTSLAVTAALILVLTLATLLRLRRLEWNRR